MPKSNNQKQKLLYILKFFYEETDEEHTFTVQQIIDKLECYGISAARRSIYDDIRALQDYGFDIVMRKGRSYEYFLGSRLFETAELKILIDTIQSSRFITKRKSEQIIKKLASLTSKPQSAKLKRELYLYDRIKSMNESILYNVDTIHAAIAENKKISFKYFDFDLKRNKIFRKNGGNYITNPMAMTFDNENYYLISYNDKYGDYVHYRVDKMTEISVLTEKRTLPDEKFNAANYVKPMFAMFDGKIEQITAVFHNSYLNVIIDRFGDNVRLSEAEGFDEAFKAVFKAAISPVFLSWIMGFGSGALIISPQWVANEVKELAFDVIDIYEEK